MKNIPFEFWCQKVLPLVYDDSLSYYEILCKIKEKLNVLIDEWELLKEIAKELGISYEELKKYVDDYFNNLNLNGAISDKLNEMYENGQLADIINATYGKLYGYSGLDRAFGVQWVGDTVIQSKRYYKQVTPVKYLLENNTLGYLTPVNLVNLDVPVVGAGCVECDGYLGTPVNVVVKNNATLSFRDLFFDSSANKTVDINHGTIVIGKHAIPSVSPKYSGFSKRSEIVDCAKTFYDARVSGRKFAYGSNFITNTNNNIVNDSNGAARMECDTFVSCVMLGLKYSDTPYSDATPNKTASFTDLPSNPNGYSWILPWTNNDVLGRKVTWTGGQNWWLWDNGYVFKNMEAVEDGDIVIFRKDGGAYFDGIKHIGIIKTEAVNGVKTPYVYHITGSNEVESPMMFEPLSNVISRGNYNTDTDVYFARPNYQ